MVLSTRKSRKKFLSPIGLIIALMAGLVVTGAFPFGFAVLDPIICPQNGCSVNMETRRGSGEDRRGQYSTVSFTPVCRCAGGGARNIPAWAYLVHFVAIFLIAYFPSALIHHRRDRVRLESDDDEPPSDDIGDNVHMGRVLFLLLGIIFVVGFFIYVVI